MSAIGALPVGEFAKNVDSAGGILGHIGVGVGQTPRAAAPEADYLTQGAIRREGGEAILDSPSRTDLVTIYVGMVWSR